MYGRSLQEDILVSIVNERNEEDKGFLFYFLHKLNLNGESE